MIYIKDTEVLLSIAEAPAHLKLLEVMAWLCKRFPQMICITSGYRKGDPGIHGTNPFRAIDLRSTYFQQPLAIQNEINNHWIYDPERTALQVAWWHKVDDGAYHFHIQVHDNTRMA